MWADSFVASESEITGGGYSENIYHRHFSSYSIRLFYRPMAWIESRFLGECVTITSDKPGPIDYGDSFEPPSR